MIIGSGAGGSMTSDLIRHYALSVMLIKALYHLQARAQNRRCFPLLLFPAPHTQASGPGSSPQDSQLREGDFPVQANWGVTCRNPHPTGPALASNVLLRHVFLPSEEKTKLRTLEQADREEKQPLASPVSVAGGCPTEPGPGLLLGPHSFLTHFPKITFTGFSERKGEGKTRRCFVIK